MKLYLGAIAPYLWLFVCVVLEENGVTITDEIFYSVLLIGMAVITRLLA